MFYWFTFEDGYRVCAKGFDEIEMHHLVLKHGKLIEKVRARTVTDNEIKTSLKIYREQLCRGCKVEKTICCPVCIGTIISQTLELISRLEAETEKYYNAAKNQQDVSMKRFFEIKRLKEENESLKLEYAGFEAATKQIIKSIKTEAIKEFAERLKKEVEMISYEMCSNYQDTIDAIDETYKEMVGE